jgi:hypothetical protein
VRVKLVGVEVDHGRPRLNGVGFFV